MHAMENKGWWQYLFRKTIPRRLKWNLKLSAPQSGVKPPAAPLSTSGRQKKKNGVGEKNDDCYAITARAAKEEREPARKM
jgi:hypothetical protein